MRIITFVFIVAFLTACMNNDKQGENNEKATRNLDIDIPEPDLLDRLSYQKNNLDSLILENKLIEKSYCKLVDGEEILEISLDSIVDNLEIEKLYNTWENSSGKIVVVGEYPYSQSGDWTAGYVHYFDEKGLTFAIESSSNHFIEEGVATESTIDYYNSNFNKVDSKYSLSDEHQSKLDEDKFGHWYKHENDAYKNVRTLLKTKKIK